MTLRRPFILSKSYFPKDEACKTQLSLTCADNYSRELVLWCFELALRRVQTYNMMREDSRGHVRDLYREIAQELERLAGGEFASTTRLEWFRQQHKGSKLLSHGIKTPAARKLIKKHKEHFQQLSIEEKLELAKQFYTSGVFEQAAFGDTLLELSANDLTPVHYDKLDEVTNHLNNWASVDWLCLHGIQDLLLKYRSQTLELLARWNRSDNLWKRRASVVAFVRRIGSSGKFTDILLEFCENLIRDEEDIVRKGVGWALKDNISGARKEVIEYIKSLRQRGVSSSITLYAIQDLKGEERKTILKVKAQ